MIEPYAQVIVNGGTPALVVSKPYTSCGRTWVRVQFTERLGGNNEIKPVELSMITTPRD